jgi:hypothetical protein
MTRKNSVSVEDLREFSREELKRFNIVDLCSEACYSKSPIAMRKVLSLAHAHILCRRIIAGIKKETLEQVQEALREAVRLHDEQIAPSPETVERWRSALGGSVPASPGNHGTPTFTAEGRSSD